MKLIVESNHQVKKQKLTSHHQYVIVISHAKMQINV